MPTPETAADLPNFRKHVEVLRNGNSAQRELASQILQTVNAMENIAALAATNPSPAHLADWGCFGFTHAQAVRAHIAKEYPLPRRSRLSPIEETQSEVSR